MPIEIFTGLPGNGKTAFMVEKLIAEAAKAERPIVASGIDGLAPGLALELKDAREWNAHDYAAPEELRTCDCHGDGVLHAHLIPDGSLIFVDEAWKHFGHLQDASRQATPKHVTALAEHRHRGIDFVWTTQMPNQIYPFARGLVAGHTHVVRRFGTQYCDLFRWEELNEEVKSSSKRDNAQKSHRMLPKQVFAQYKSATQHTIKRRLPFKLFVLPVAVVGAVVAAYFAYQSLKPGAMSERLGVAAAETAPAGSPQGPERSAKSSWASAAEYIKAHQPLIASIPGSAPVFAGRGVTTDPELFCMKADAGTDALDNHLPESCRCFTEQGTVYAIDGDQCRNLARWGPPYNPYKERRDEERRELGQERETGVGQGPTASAVGVGEAGIEGQQARYGSMRGSAPSADPAFGG